MSARKLALCLRLFVHRSRVVQIGLILGFWLIGEGLARLTHLPIPGGIIGMIILLGLIASDRISLSSTRRGANWFLAEMLLFFVPACLAVLSHHELFGLTGVKVLAVIMAGTLSVMLTTALVVEYFYRWRLGHDRPHVILGE